MQKIMTLLALTFFSTLLSGQSNYETFKKLFKEKDTAKIRLLLAAWEKTQPEDPELYTAAFNFYFLNSKQEMLSLQQKEPEKESFKLTDSTGKVAGFLTSDMGYDPDQLNKAFKYINTGIQKFPDRLDMRFGKCYVFGQIGDYDNFTKEIIQTIEYSVVNKNNWLWTENKKQDNGTGFMLATIQDYLRQLYDTEEDDLLNNIIQIGQVTLKYYPDNIEILSTTSVALMLMQQYDKAIEYLKRAEKLNPEDYIILNNLAEGYKRKGDKINAIRYYELTEKYGSEDAKRQARQSIKELQK